MTQAGEELARLIAGASSLEDANTLLSAWTEDTSMFGPIGDVLFVTTAMADMAGQLMVAGREAQVVQLAAGDPVRPPSPKAFLDLPWDDAINAFKKRGLVRDEDFETLLEGYAQRSAIARRLMLQHIQSRVMEHLTDAITTGETFPDFAKKVNTLTTDLGLAQGKPSYLQMVFRTNVQSAYGAGRYRAIRNPNVMRSRPFVQYRTAKDARVRDEHAVLNGLVYNIDDPVWQRIAPPNGFQCRCAVVTLSREEAANIPIRTDIPAEYIPTPGFDQAPIPELDLTDTAEPEIKRPAPMPQPVPKMPSAGPPMPAPPPAPKPVPPTTGAPSKRVGEIAEQVFGRKLSDADIENLAASKASLPKGYSIRSKVGERQDEVHEVTLSGEIMAGKQSVAGTFTHTYTANPEGGVVVKHNAFFVDSLHQDKGIGREVFNSLIDGYEKQGITKVTLDASEIGKYVWTKAGFEWDDPAQLAQALTKLRAQLTQRFGASVATEALKTTKTPGDIARLVIEGERVGKSFLIELDELIPMSQTPAKIKRL